MYGYLFVHITLHGFFSEFSVVRGGGNDETVIDCIGFFATFPLIHPDQVYPNSTNIRSIGTVVKDQVIKWDHLR